MTRRCAKKAAFMIHINYNPSMCVCDAVIQNSLPLDEQSDLRLHFQVLLCHLTVLLEHRHRLLGVRTWSEWLQNKHKKQNTRVPINRLHSLNLFGVQCKTCIYILWRVCKKLRRRLVQYLPLHIHENIPQSK